MSWTTWWCHNGQWYPPPPLPYPNPNPSFLVKTPTKLNTLSRKRRPSVFCSWTNAPFFWRAMDFSGKMNRAGLLGWSPGWQIKVWKWAKHTSFLLELHFSQWKKTNLLYLWSSHRTICTLLRTDNMCNCFTQTNGFTQESHPGDPEDALFRSQEKISGEHVPVFFCCFLVFFCEIAAISTLMQLKIFHTHSVHSCSKALGSSQRENTKLWGTVLKKK